MKVTMIYEPLLPERLMLSNYRVGWVEKQGMIICKDVLSVEEHA
jgi:hypothetical protein